MSNELDNITYRFDYGELNDVQPGTSGPVFRPQSGREGFASLVGRGISETFRPNSAAEKRTKWYGVCFRVETGEGLESTDDTTGWDRVLSRFEEEPGARIRIRVRIPELHAALPEPISYSNQTGSMTMADNLAVDAHPLFIGEAPNMPVPSVGEIVKVKYNRNSGQAIYLGKLGAGGAGGTAGSFGNQASGAFVNGTWVPGATPSVTPSVVAPGEVQALSNQFDTMRANPEEDPAFLEEYGGTKTAWMDDGSQFNPAFTPYVKAFLVEIWTGNEHCGGRWTCRFNSVYRANSQVDPVGPNAAAGSSMHNYGLAFDINPRHFPEGSTSKDYQLYKSRVEYEGTAIPGTTVVPESSAEGWLLGGMPQTWKKLGGDRWCGARTTVPERSQHLLTGVPSCRSYEDSVHFAKTFGLSVSTLQSMVRDQLGGDFMIANRLNLSTETTT